MSSRCVRRAVRAVVRTVVQRAGGPGCGGGGSGLVVSFGFFGRPPPPCSSRRPECPSLCGAASPLPVSRRSSAPVSQSKPSAPRLPPSAPRSPSAKGLRTHPVCPRSARRAPHALGETPRAHLQLPPFCPPCASRPRRNASGAPCRFAPRPLAHARGEILPHRRPTHPAMPYSRPDCVKLYALKC